MQRLPITTYVRDAIVAIEATARERIAVRRAGAPPVGAKAYPTVDAHDHGAMLERHAHFVRWLEAQRLEVEQRLRGRALHVDTEEGV
jgi:hypothetical protein